MENIKEMEKMENTKESIISGRTKFYGRRGTLSIVDEGDESERQMEHRLDVYLVGQEEGDDE